jgi:hypothetical protein
VKTLVTDPFADDAISILEWGYGQLAKDQFMTRVAVLQQRAGQAFMNTLADWDPPEYARLSGSGADPFYQDTKLRAAIDKLTSKY